MNIDNWNIQGLSIKNIEVYNELKHYKIDIRIIIINIRIIKRKAKLNELKENFLLLL